MAPAARERPCPSPPRSARSRPRDAGRSGRCHRRADRSSRRGCPSPSPSTRDASRAARGPTANPTRASTRSSSSLAAFQSAKSCAFSLVYSSCADPRTRLDLARVEPRQSAVARELVDREVHRAVFGLIRHALRDQPLDQRDHLRDVVRRARIVLRRLDAQVLAVCVEDARPPDRSPARIVCPRSLARLMILSSTSVRFITCSTLHPRNASDAPQQILEQERAEIAQVRRVVDRRAAGVHAHAATVGGRERLDLAGQRVVKEKLAHRLGGRTALGAPLRGAIMPTGCGIVPVEPR